MITIDLVQKKFYIFNGLAITASNDYVGHAYAITRYNESKKMFDTSEDARLIKEWLEKNKVDLQSITQEQSLPAKQLFHKRFLEGSEDSLNSIVRSYKLEIIRFPQIGDYNCQVGTRKLTDYEIL